MTDSQPSAMTAALYGRQDRLNWWKSGANGGRRTREPALSRFGRVQTGAGLKTGGYDGAGLKTGGYDGPV
jgi:hypothetical protein